MVSDGAAVLVSPAMVTLFAVLADTQASDTVAPRLPCKKFCAVCVDESVWDPVVGPNRVAAL